MRVVFWGTYDTGKPRVRILIRGLKENGVEVVECHKDVWSGIEDKSQIKGPFRKSMLLLKWLLAYPVLIWRYLRLPKHDAVVVGYLGQLDVLILWPFARLRGVPIVLDAFLSLYNTVVEDRAMLRRGNPLACLLWTWEWAACKAADMIMVDTSAHGKYFIDTFAANSKKVKRVFVGAETDMFDSHPPTPRDPNQPFTVLFYGQFIPLHGIDTVVRAAKLTESASIRWIIIGTGQESQKVKALVASLNPTNLEQIDWIPYGDLIDWIQKADVCLGIFGNTEKAGRVIPNKVFQILASGRPVITRDSEAIRELLPPGTEGIWLATPACPEDIVAGVRHFQAHPVTGHLHADLVSEISPRSIGLSVVQAIQCASVG
jgi:glycosyltransferase involved in cell wall biosynthesis